MFFIHVLNQIQSDRAWSKYVFTKVATIRITQKLSLMTVFFIFSEKCFSRKNESKTITVCTRNVFQKARESNFFKNSIISTRNVYNFYYFWLFFIFQALNQIDYLFKECNYKNSVRCFFVSSQIFFFIVVTKQNRNQNYVEKWVFCKIVCWTCLVLSNCTKYES